MKRIVCIGQSAVDITLPVNSYPVEDTKVKIGDSKFVNGGGACNNAAYLLGKWHDDVTLFSTVGNDHEGELLEKEMHGVGVKTVFSKIDNVRTTTSYIITSLSNGTRTIITNKSPLLKYNDLSVSIDADIFLVDGNDKELAKKLFLDNPNAIKVVDAGSYKEERLEIVKMCDYVVASRDFVREFSSINFDYHNDEELKVVYDKVQSEFKGLLVITLAERGCMVKLDNVFHFIPSIEVETVDSNGAGDIFHGAFVHFLIEGYDLLKVLRLSNITGAFSTRFLGTRKSVPEIDEVMNYE